MNNPFALRQAPAYRTPEQLQAARSRVRDMMSGGPDQYSRPGGWLYALGDGLGAALEQRRINQGEQYAEQQRQNGIAQFSQAIGGPAANPSFQNSFASASPSAPVADQWSGRSLAQTIQQNSQFPDAPGGSPLMNLGLLFTGGPSKTGGLY